MTLPTQAELHDLLDYNPATGELTWKLRPRSLFTSDRIFKSWNTTFAGQRAFTAVDRKGYLVGALFNVNYRAARVIFKLVHGIDADQVDHEDGDRKNNRIHNLRNVSGQQNQMNMKRPSNNTSGHIGVAWDASKKKWMAYIKVDTKRIHLGRFDDIQDAVNARKQAEQQHGFHTNHGR